MVPLSPYVDELSAAIEIQQAMAEFDRDHPDDARVVFRIGLHLGDLIVEDEDLYGDGVNVAARLEAEAPPGGIVISGNCMTPWSPDYRPRSKISASLLFVTARNSTFTYKGRAVDVKQVGRELGVRYVLETGVHRKVFGKNGGERCKCYYKENSFFNYPPRLYSIQYDKSGAT